MSAIIFIEHDCFFLKKCRLMAALSRCFFNPPPPPLKIMHSFHDVNSKFYWVSWNPILLKTILKVYSVQQEVIYLLLFNNCVLFVVYGV